MHTTQPGARCRLRVQLSARSVEEEDDGARHTVPPLEDRERRVESDFQVENTGSATD